MQTSIILKVDSYIKTLIVTICLLQIFQAHAQSKITDNLNGRVNFHSGYNLPEYSFIQSLTEDYVRSLDVSLFKETAGKNKWEQLYNYPSYGVSLFYTTLGNNKVFGKELALTYFFEVYFLSKNRFRLFNHTGIGASYVNKKFDLKNNYMNVAVGSNFNIHFNFRLGADYKLSDKFTFNTGLSFDHYSNGNTSEPNLGINCLTGFGGISYCLGQRIEKQQHEIEACSNDNSFMFFASIGGKHSRALTSTYFYTTSYSFEFSRAFTHKIHLGIGSDLFYDSSVESSLKKKNKNYKSSNSFQSGFHLSQSIVYNKMSFSLQEGIYILLTEKVNNYLIYNRGVFQYQVTDHFLVRLAMKSHLHILDYPEIGFGYKF